jgi:hypothetical protein
MIDPGIIKLVSDIVAIVAAVSVWLYIRRLEKRWGCRNDWEFMALVYKKAKVRFGGPPETPK